MEKLSTTPSVLVWRPFFSLQTFLSKCLCENLFNVEPFFVSYTESVMLGPRFIPESVFYTRSIVHIVRSPHSIFYTDQVPNLALNLGHLGGRVG